MGKSITNTVVSKAKPGDKPYEIRDSGLKGLILRVQPSGVMTYYFEYQRGKRVKVGPADALSPERARDIAKDIEHEYRKGEDPIEKRKRIQADNYLQFLDEHYKPHLEATLRNGVNNDRNVKETLANLKNGFPELHKLGLSEITPHVIERWRQRRRSEGASLARIKRQLNDLSACLNKAIDWSALTSSNPFEKVHSIKPDSSAKVRYLSGEEETKLRTTLTQRDADIKAGRQNANEWRAKRDYPLCADLTVLDFVDHLEPAVLISLNTGLRRGELLQLKWSDIDLDQKVLTVLGDGAKSGQTRHIPLNEEALTVLKKWKQQGKLQPGVKSLWLFHGPDGQPFHDMKTSWMGLLTKAETITDFRWHDLRHTFASKLVMAGVDLNTVRELLGHSDYKMTLRYAHLAPKHKQDAVDKLVPAKTAE